MKAKKILFLLLSGAAALTLAGCSENISSSSFSSAPVSQTSSSASSQRESPSIPESSSPAPTSQPPASTASQRGSASISEEHSLAAADSIVTNGGETIALSSLEHQKDGVDSTVYYTPRTSAQRP